MTTPTTMTGADYFGTLSERWHDEIVVCSLGTNSNTWWSTTASRSSFYVSAAMGFASSFALGLALNCPDERIWVLDSDGAVAMNLGGLLTEAATQPPNLVHFVLNNRCYNSLGGGQLVNAERTDYAGIARSAGIRNALTVSSRDALTEALADADGRHALIVANVEADPPRKGYEPPPRLPFEGPEMKYIFGRFMEKRLGRPVFGPSGY